MTINFNNEETIICFSGVQLHMSKEASMELAHRILDYFECDEEDIKELREETDEDRALKDIKRELTDEDRREYMNGWFAKDLDILVYYVEKLRLENRQLQEKIKIALKKNEQLKEYIAIAPNLDEMTATKYRNIQQDAYIQGRAEEQQKAEQIIYESYIPKQKIKDKIEELKDTLKHYDEYSKLNLLERVNIDLIDSKIEILEELLRESEEK